MDSRHTLDKIHYLITFPTGEPVAQDDLRSWMTDADIEVQAAAYALLRKAGGGLDVRPPLAPENYVDFFKAYLERCLRQGSAGPWSHSSHGAGWEIASWLAALFDNGSTPAPLLADLRDWLATIYRTGSSAERQTLVNATLEHLFERPTIRKYFQRWAADPVLSTAFADASLWAANGGDSPVVGRRKLHRGARKR